MKRNKEKQRYQTLKKQPPSGKKIWSEEVSHNEKASCLEDVELEFSTTEEQADINITAGDIKSGVSKMANWEGSRP